MNLNLLMKYNKMIYFKQFFINIKRLLKMNSKIINFN